jgi:hypothetical protein
MRLTLIGAGLALAMLNPAQAQAPNVPPNGPPEAARFTMQPVEGGLMKLDTTTGTMSFCAAKAGTWVCEAVPEDRAALEAEIARLQRRIAELEKGRAGTGTGGTGTGVPDIMAPPSADAPKDEPLGPPEAAKPAPAPPASKSEQELSEEARKRLDQAMDMVEQVFRRFFDMVDQLRREEGAQDQKL